MQEITVRAELNQLDPVISFVETQLEEQHCSTQIRLQIEVCIEEMFVNVANYAYGESEGTATLRMEVQENGMFVLELIDSGMPFNPLIHEDPDIHLDADEREIGGLGILMVRKTMDVVEYRYENKENHLVMKKAIR